MNPLLLPKKPNEKLLNKIHENLSYNCKTGVVSWIYQNNKIKPGTEAGRIDKRGYRTIEFRNNRKYDRAISCHHIAWYLYYGSWPKQQIDHKNGIRNDNRINNLRLCDRLGNAKNHAIYKSCSSGITGVLYRKDLDKYQAGISVNKKKIHLGTFLNIEDAKEARYKAEKKYFGEFRRQLVSKVNWVKLLHNSIKIGKFDGN